MAALVAEVAKQGAVGLVQLEATPLALCVVRFFEIDGDQAVEMAGEDTGGGAVSRIGQEFEGQAAGWFIRLAAYRQLQPEEAVNQPTLGDFEPVPCFFVPNLAEIGDHPREATRAAQ